MELIKVYEKNYIFYKVVVEHKRQSIDLLAFDATNGNLVARISVSILDKLIFNFETTSDFTYGNKKFFEDDLEQAIKIAC